MAEEEKIGGYQCEFVDQVPEELVCKSCKLVAREPHTTDCCGERFCQVCIDTILKDKKPCPSCGEAEFSTFFIKGAHKKILALPVYCTMKKKDCEWVGRLEQLDTHLDTECQYVDVECPSKCDQKVQKRNLATHLEKDCPKREYRCPYCNFKATCEIVSNIHWPECLYYPVRCPKLCGVTCDRETMEDHELICPLEEVECELSYAGCKETFLRQDQDEHMEKNTQKHLSLMATATLRISRKFEQKLQEKDQQMKAVEERFQKELQERDQKHAAEVMARKAVEEKLQKELQKRDQKHAAEVMALKTQTDDKIHEAIKTLAILPYHFTVADYKQLKTKDAYGTSEYLYTHPRGYKYLILVFPNGCIEGRNTHLSVYFYSVPGEFDATLPWPAKATIILQLLNQCRNEDHMTVTKTFEWEKKTENAHAGTFSNTFISHAELRRNAQTQYLKDNCLRFRISKIEICE